MDPGSEEPSRRDKELLVELFEDMLKESREESLEGFREENEDIDCADVRRDMAMK